MTVEDQVRAGLARIKKEVIDPLKAENTRLKARVAEMENKARRLLLILGTAREDEEVDATTQAGGYLCGDTMSEAIEQLNAALAKQEGR